MHKKKNISKHGTDEILRAEKHSKIAQKNYRITKESVTDGEFHDANRVGKRPITTLILIQFL